MASTCFTAIRQLGLMGCLGHYYPRLGGSALRRRMAAEDPPWATAVAASKGELAVAVLR